MDDRFGSSLHRDSAAWLVAACETEHGFFMGNGPGSQIGSDWTILEDKASFLCGLHAVLLWAVSIATICGYCSDSCRYTRILPHNETRRGNDDFSLW